MSRQPRQCRCPKCGGLFLTLIGNQVYCSGQCRKSAENARLYWARKARKR